MSITKNDGICYLCGNTIRKSGMTTHLKKEVCPAGDVQLCNLLKIEDQYNKDYWLYLDIPATSALSSLDRFLRNIWLECCGHMSQFYLPDDQVVGKTNRISILSRGKKLCYDYDFGTPTSLSSPPWVIFTGPPSAVPCGCWPGIRRPFSRAKSVAKPLIGWTWRSIRRCFTARSA